MTCPYKEYQDAFVVFVLFIETERKLRNYNPMH